MFYTAEKREWTLFEFTRNHRVPCLAMVTQGFCGETQHNELDKGQVLRIQGNYTEHRLHAQILKDTEKTFGGAAITVSIPLNCDIPVFVIKKGKISNNPTFFEMIESKLPFDVQLDTSKNTACQLRSGPIHHPVRGTVQLRVYEKQSMNYIYGNPVSKDIIYKNVISILVDDCDAKLSLVTGLVSGDTENYNRLMEQMSDAVDTYVNFKENIGHRDMFVSSFMKLVKDDIKLDGRKSNCDSKRKPDDLYVYVKPSPVILDNHVYEELGECMRKPMLCAPPQHEILSDGAEGALPTEQDTHYHEPQDLRMSATDHNARDPLKGPGPLPPRPKRKSGKDNAKAQKPLPVSPQDVMKTNTIHNETRNTITSSDVKKLTIEELSQYLDSLKLSRHSEKFKAEQVDGCLLQEMDEALLQEEFGFTRFESIKLIKFAKTGYLPQSSTEHNS